MSNAGSPRKKAVALIAGPTASGKSDLAVELALELRRRGARGVVINADSAQVYRDLRVLSARLSEEEMRGVEHRLFGAWDGGHACSAAEWAHAARQEVAALHCQGAVPILCGGTGMYLKVLLEGIAAIPPIDPVVREEVRAMSAQDAWAALLSEDPQRGAMLAPGDSQRIARALEVVRSSGTTLGEWQRAKEGGIADAVELFPVVLLPERERLYARCDERFARLLETGAVAEVEALLARQLAPTLPVMRAIGVPEIAGWLRGEWSRAEALARGRQATRNYAKRQYTWFRRQPPLTWTRLSKSNVFPSEFATLFHHLRLT